MHLSTHKSLRTLLTIALAAQCSIADAKRVDRRIQNAPVKRSLVAGVPIATGLETTGIGYLPAGGIPNGGAHVVSAAPTSCIPGQQGCYVPTPVQANMTPLASPPMWPLLLQAGLGAFRSFNGGGSSGSGLFGGSSSRDMGSSPIAPSGRPSRSTSYSDDSDAPRPPVPPSMNSRTGQPESRNRRADVSAPQSDAKSCPQQGQTGLKELLSKPVDTAVRSSNDPQFQTLSYVGPEGLHVRAIAGGRLTVTRQAIAGKPDKIKCQKVLKIINAKCIDCSLTVSFEMPKAPSGSAGVNSCEPGEGTRECMALVVMGTSTDVINVDVRFHDPQNRLTTEKFLAPANRAVADKGTASQPHRQ